MWERCQKIDFLIFFPLFRLYLKKLHDFWKTETCVRKSIQFYLKNGAKLGIKQIQKCEKFESKKNKNLKKKYFDRKAKK